MSKEERMQLWYVEVHYIYFKCFQLKLLILLQISILDDSIGKVVNALKEKQMLENSVILFFCDNGAPIVIDHSNGGSNSPFKGVITFYRPDKLIHFVRNQVNSSYYPLLFQQKESPWEGAVRSAGVIWSPLLQNRERTSHQLFHISDWVPTFGEYLPFLCLVCTSKIK